MAKKRILNELPIEMVEEILLNLPVKSVLRFSSVSKTWESMISKSWFVKRYASRSRRDKIVLTIATEWNWLEKVCKSYNFSSILNLTSSAVEATSSTENCVSHVGECDEFVVSQFETPCNLPLASCGELWLVFLSKANSIFPSESLFVWNPSSRMYKKLSFPSLVLCHPSFKTRGQLRNLFNFGLGYDSVGDDYKILVTPCWSKFSFRAELYSLKSGSWRDVPDFSRYRHITPSCGNAFVNGNIHWMSPHLRPHIVSFDFSTEKFGEVINPPTPVEMEMIATMVSVLNGMLCVSVNVGENYVIWVMEDYGVPSSWTTKFTIKNMGFVSKIKALHLFENGAILFQGYNDAFKVFIQQDEKTSPKQLTNGDSRLFYDIASGIVYTDSLVAPASFV